MRSIRIYLIVVLLSVICLGNFIAALNGYRSSMEAADKLVDRQILEKVQTLRALLKESYDPPADIFAMDTLYQLWKGDQLIQRSPNAPQIKMSPQPMGYHYISHNGIRWRVWIDDPAQAVELIVGQRADVYAKLNEDILLKSILPIIWILPILGILVWIVISLGLKPLSELAKLLNNRRADDFETIDSSRYPGELTIIISSLNRLFNRNIEAFDREKRFSADAAHELRTPLAALKLGLYNLSESTVSEQAVEKLRGSVERMGHSIEQILAFHRVTLDQIRGETQECDLKALAKTIIADHYSQIEKKNQNIELEAEPTQVVGDPFMLTLMMRNLLDNAIKYTPIGGSIHMGIDSDDSGASMCIEDSGPGVEESEYARIGERFYRVGGDRHASGVIGSGLGLSIVTHCVQLHRGRISFSRSAKLGGLAVEVFIPQTGEPYSK